MWTHWSLHPITAVHPATQEQPRFDKPTGLWISDETQEDCWSNWCKINECSWINLPYKYEFKLVESDRLLKLSSAHELIEFTKKYPYKYNNEPRYMRDYIDWMRVAEEYGGIIITPYIWECRLKLNWYYTWDVASGCIWDPSLIESFTRA